MVSTWSYHSLLLREDVGSNCGYRSLAVPGVAIPWVVGTIPKAQCHILDRIRPKPAHKRRNGLDGHQLPCCCLLQPAPSSDTPAVRGGTAPNGLTL